jgi:hypothetical protein
MTPAATRARPEPAGEPRPTPVEDVPDVATPPPAPRPEPQPDDDLGQYAPDQGRAEAFRALLPGAGVDQGGYGDSYDEPSRDDHPLSAPEALAEVIRRVPAIAKGRTSDQGYRFRGIDDVYASLHDLFAEVGLVVLPRPIERIGEVRLVGSKGDRSQYVTHLLVEFRFLASDGTSETCSAWGEGSDMGDKATQKAHSQAMKSALLETFLIPTEDSVRDEPDATNPEPSRAFTQQEQDRARTALDAAVQASTLDALVVIGRRAHAGGLLDVPVTIADGSIAPLRVHLDRIRVALEAQVQS